MKKKLFFLIIVLILIATSYNVQGMGFGGKNEYVTFQPGLEEEFSWILITTSNIARNYSVNIHGDLAEYCTVESGNFLEMIKPNANPDVIVKIKLPDEEPSPGIHVIDVVLKELPTFAEKSQGIYALSGAIPRIHVNVLYEGKYLDNKLNVEDVNTGEIIKPILELHNYGKEEIKDLDVKFEIYDENNNRLKTSNDLEYKNYILESDEEIIIEGELSSAGLDGGSYTIKADISWDGENHLLEKGVRIGNMDVEIINYTHKLQVDKINEFDLEIESKWNGRITDVYGEININGQNVKTANYNLNAWEKIKISGYINTVGMEEGTYNVDATIYYGSESKKESFDVVIEKGKSSFEITSTVLIIMSLAIVVVLLIGLNIFFLMKKEKRNEKGKHKKR